MMVIKVTDIRNFLLYILSSGNVLRSSNLMNLTITDFEAIGVSNDE